MGIRQSRPAGSEVYARVSLRNSVRDETERRLTSMRRFPSRRERGRWGTPKRFKEAHARVRERRRIGERIKERRGQLQRSRLSQISWICMQIAAEHSDARNEPCSARARRDLTRRARDAP